MKWTEPLVFEVGKRGLSVLSTSWRMSVKRYSASRSSSDRAIRPGAVYRIGVDTASA